MPAPNLMRVRISCQSIQKPFLFLQTLIGSRIGSLGISPKQHLLLGFWLSWWRSPVSMRYHSQFSGFINTVCRAILSLVRDQNPQSVVLQAESISEWSLKKESYLWLVGAFHHAHLGNSIPWIMIGCCSIHGHISIYIYIYIYISF